jgi:hypothetical protein
MYKNLIDKIKNGFSVNSEETYKDFVGFFLDNNAENERLEIYKEKMKSSSLSSEAEAKYSILKQLFSNYVQYSLREANIAIVEKNKFLAKEHVDSLAKLMDIFKNHDVSDYNKFIIDSESRITDIEVSLLFKKPILNKKELDKLSAAFIQSFGKKKAIKNKEEFQREFFNHPLIQCLDGYSDIRMLEKNIEEGKIELGEYKNLVEAMLKLREKINAEQYQGFITFVIHEDLAYGLKNIIKNDKYEPNFLSVMLNEMTKGNVLDNDNIEALIREIKINHTRNVSLNNWSTLHERKSSVAALNDYGFDVKVLPELKLFIHGHATENAGGDQNDQQVNTSAILREKSGLNTIGLTVMLNEITRTDNHRAFLHDFSHLMHFSKSDEIIFSGLQFDSAFISNLSLKDNLSVESLKNGDLLSSNHYIVKKDIKRSQEIINNNIGKNDYELLCEKKNAHMRIVANNKELFKNVLRGVSSDNQLMFQLVGEPFLTFLKATLNIESSAGISLFSGKEVELINEVVSVDVVNTKLKSLRKDCLDSLKMRDFVARSYKDIGTEKYVSLSKIGENDLEKEKRTEKEKSTAKDHIKKFNSSKLSLAKGLEYLEQNPINGEYKEAYKKKLIIALRDKVISEAENGLSYSSEKNKSLVAGLKATVAELTGSNFLYHLGLNKEEINLEKSRSIEFKKTDTSLSKEDNNFKNKYNVGDIRKTLAILLKDGGKTERQIQEDTLILNGLLSIADLCNQNIKVRSQNLKEEIKNKNRKP